MENTPEIPKPTRLQKVTSKLIYGIIFLSTIAIIILFYWTVQNPMVLEARNAPFPVRPGSNTPGQIEFITLDYCKTYKATGTVVARLVGRKSIIRIPWPVDSSVPQCLKTEAPIVIPTYATDDTYYFDFTITYQVNPIKKKVVYLKSQEFTVKAIP